MRKPCLTTTCKNYTSGGSYCDTCTRERNHTRNTKRTWYRGNWQSRRKQVLEAWIAEHGYLCPGYNTDPHPSTDLTVDHVNNRDDTVLRVLCRPCNSRKG